MHHRTLLLGALSFAIAAPAEHWGENGAPSHAYDHSVMDCDVVVIGGGASGTYGAIQLSDMGKSVVVVERDANFGGHVATYADPKTGRAIDYGVQAYYDAPIARNFFSRFNVETYSPSFGAGTTIFADFQTGKTLRNFTGGGYDFSAYAAQLHKYPDLSLGWDLPTPLPEDLLLPFGQFIKKYNLESVAYTIAGQSWGTGDLLDSPTVYVFFHFNRITLDELSGSVGGITTYNNSELYFKARAELGSRALTNSMVVSGSRSKHGPGANLVVRTPSGKKHIRASQVLMSAPITLENMLPFGLDERERSIFSQIQIKAYYATLLSNTGLPENFTFNNADPSQPYGIPLLPTAYTIVPHGSGYFHVWYGANEALPEAQVKSDISATIQRLSNSSCVPEFVGYSSHTPLLQYVSDDALKNGFYDDLTALQGYRNMWYTGNAFSESGSVGVWNYTAQLVPKIVAALG
jgi:hypothetical protein